MSDKDGGPAFPGIDGQDGHGHGTRRVDATGMAALVFHNQGMTLWDYYAAAAITGDLASQSVEAGEWAESCFPGLAARAALIADAMLAERKKRGI